MLITTPDKTKEIARRCTNLEEEMKQNVHRIAYNANASIVQTIMYAQSYENSILCFLVEPKSIRCLFSTAIYRVTKTPQTE